MADEIGQLYRSSDIPFTSVAANDENMQRLTVQPHSPSKLGISVTLQGPTAYLTAPTASRDGITGYSHCSSVPVSPPNRVDLHDWDSRRHTAPESIISAGYNCNESPTHRREIIMH